jgi:preprotein translocase subunit SecA
MFVDLMHDIYSTFTERFLRAQIVFSPFGSGGQVASGGGSGSDGPNGAGGPGSGGGGRPGGGNGPRPGSPASGGAGRGPTKRYNALGILEDVPPDEPPTESAKKDAVQDVGPSEPPNSKPVARPEHTIVGAGRPRSLSGAAAPAASAVDWSTVGRNDPCPCGSGKKYKKCHGAQG